MIPIKDGNIVYDDTIKLDKPGNKIAIYEETRKSLANYFQIPKAGIELSPINNGSLTVNESFDFTGWDDKINKSFNSHATFTIDLAVVGTYFIIEIFNFKIQSYIDYSSYQMPDWYDMDVNKYYSNIDSTGWANKTMKNFDAKNREILANIRENVFHK